MFWGEIVENRRCCLESLLGTLLWSLRMGQPDQGSNRPRTECDSQADLSLSTGQTSLGVSEVIGAPPSSDTVQKEPTGDSPAADVSSTGQAKSYMASRTFLPQWLVTIWRRTCTAPSLVATEKLTLLGMVEG